MLGLLGSQVTALHAANLTVSALDDGVYLYQSERTVEGFGRVSGNGLVVLTGKQKAVLIDTPWDDEDVDSLFAWLAAEHLSLEAVIVTHSHEDAGGHLARFHEQNIPSWSYGLTNQLLIAKGETPAQHSIEQSAWVIPDNIEVFYPGPGHTMDNSVVWIKAHHLLFGGCFVRELATASMGYTAEGDVSAWPASVSKVTARYPDIKKVVPGHGAVGGINLLEHTAALAVQHHP